MKLFAILYFGLGATVSFNANGQDFLTLQDGRPIKIKIVNADRNHIYFEKDSTQRKVRIEVVKSISVKNLKKALYISSLCPALESKILGISSDSSEFVPSPILTKSIANTEVEATEGVEAIWNPKDLSYRTERYAIVKIVERIYTKKVLAIIDSGDFTAFFENVTVKSKSGEMYRFNSVADCLNYMNYLGYELIECFEINGDFPRAWNFSFRKKLH